MKVIDEKGRLFGKINIIDLLVVVLLLSLTPMFYFGYKIFNKKVSEVKVQEEQQKPRKEFIEIMINCKFTKVNPEVLKMISVGDKEWDSDGNLIGEVVSLGDFLPYIHKFYIGPSQQLDNEDLVLRQAAVALKINAEVRGKNIYYKEKQILEGGMLEFSSGKYSVGIEDVTIVKDSYNTVIDNALLNDSGKEAKVNLDDLKKEFALQLSTLEIKMDSLLEQLANKINRLENMMNSSNSGEKSKR